MTINIDYIHKLLNYEKIESGLYIVPTPIGNLSDITIRSLKVLSCVDLIICEDTRLSKKLTSSYEIRTPLMPFHKFNSKKMIPKIIKKLLKPTSIALITDSGTPVISDPGSDLIKEIIANDIKLFSLPGPSASIASYVTSNFASTSFSFKGFFPRNKKEISSILNHIQTSDSPTIFFESPKRIIKTLNFILDNHKDCKITFVRELTKKYEEILNLKISELINILLKRDKILGEITFILEPSTNKPEKNISKLEIINLSNKLYKAGYNTSDVSKIVSIVLGISKREVYQMIIKKRNDLKIIQ